MDDMTYALGLDLGTTYTAAAIWRDGTVDMVGLGTHSHVIPSVVHLREDGTLVTGEAALRRAATEPGRTGREFKRRLGDPTPMLLGGTPLAAPDLMTALLRDVLATVTEREGGPPAAVALTHPANWGQFKIDLLRQSAVACGLTDVALVTEPVAAAVHYAAGAGVAPGATVAVFDLGGGTFDVAVLRRTDDGFELLGEPVGLERVGGVDFDHAVMAHVERAVADALGSRSPSDPEVAVALARLHDECVAAKEGLSEDSEVTIPVALPGLWTDVRMTRQEFESMIAPVLAEPMRAFQRGLASAGVTGDELDAVVMVGGSSRVPLVAETVASALGRPVALDTHPKHAVALGAARLIGAAAADVAAPPLAAEPSPVSAPAPVTEGRRHRSHRSPPRPSAPGAGADRCWRSVRSPPQPPSAAERSSRPQGATPRRRPPVQARRHRWGARRRRRRPRRPPPTTVQRTPERRARPSRHCRRPSRCAARTAGCAR
jgi:molecular chaperone DnaK (HSP70)